MAAAAVTPQRPPRKPGQRPEGRSAGLLVDVVRTLTTSPSAAQKELQKERLEKDFAVTTQTVDRLLTVHQQDLTTSLQSFRKVSAKLSTARERVRSVKNNLSSCKSLLYCKREELKQLWLESAEQKHVVRLLERIESVRSVPQQVSDSISKKRFLFASELLMNAAENIEGSLAKIEGLNEVKDNVKQKAEETFNEILSEIDKQLYIKPSEELLFELRRIASLRKAGGLRSSADDGISSKIGLPGSVKSLSGVYLRASEDDSPILQDNGYVYEDPNDSSPETNPVQYLAVLIESLGFLGRLSDAVEQLKHRMQKGLTKMIQHTTMFVYEHLASPDQVMGDNRLLSELLQLLFRQFKAVAILHGISINQFIRVRNNHRDVTNFECYSIDDVWKQVQNALQLMLNDYLDVRNVGVTRMTNVVGQMPVSFSSYFSKKRPTRSKKATFFRFEATTHAINVLAYSKEQKYTSLRTATSTTTYLSSPENPEQIYVCPPCTENVTVAFRPVMRFVVEIENKLPHPCQLRQFLEEYTRDAYLPKIRTDTSQKLDAILHADAFDVVASTEETKQLSDVKAPLLTSTIKIAEICRQIESLMQSAPAFGENFAEIWLFVLDTYEKKAKEIYESSTKTIVRVQSNAEEQERRKISAAWAVDLDISRLLKSLPNWMALTDVGALATSTTTPFTPSAMPTPVVESAQEIRRRNQRESEILIGNLGMQKKIEDYEVIVDDPNRLRLLANIHESVEWLVKEVKLALLQLPPTMLNKLKEAHTTSLEPNRQSFANLFVQFEKNLNSLEEMSATCLLMLHLEVRVHCFYYLLPIAKQTTSPSQSQEVDELVVRLNKDLVQLNELLTSSLQSRKVKYVFEGLGHLVSSIFVNSAYHITKINDGGKKRMCRNIFAIQQCLSTITSTRESDLDAARKYFELLYKTPDEILNGIVENGPDYNELEYHNLLALAIRSHPVFGSEPGALEQRVNRLREIMKERRKR